jgi:hypothetical protein
LRSGNSAVFFALCRSPTAGNTIRPFQETNYLMLNHLKQKKIDFKNQDFFKLLKKGTFEAKNDL